MLKNIIYYLLNLTFYNFEKKLIELTSKKKKLTIFDVGCFKGFFFRKFYHSNKLRNKRKKFYLFDVNPNVKKYLSTYIKKKNINFHYSAIGDKNKKGRYNFNRFFESSGSSMSNIYKNDKLWVQSRKLFLRFFFQKTPDHQSIIIPVITLDSFVKKNKVKKIDILKIDVDGSEEEVLRGMKSVLKKSIISIILVEITAKKKIFYLKENRIISFLKRNNFKLILKKNVFSVSILSNLKCTDNLFVHEIIK